MTGMMRMMIIRDYDGDDQDGSAGKKCNAGQASREKEPQNHPLQPTEKYQVVVPDHHR